MNSYLKLQLFTKDYYQYLKPYYFVNKWLSPIRKSIKIRRTEHARHFCTSRDELINDVLQWTPSHGRAKVERPTRTYIQQVCADTGCSPEDQPEAMDDGEGWRERVSDIRAEGATWWWWWLKRIRWWYPKQRGKTPRKGDPVYDTKVHLVVRLQFRSSGKKPKR